MYVERHWQPLVSYGIRLHRFSWNGRMFDCLWRGVRASLCTSMRCVSMCWQSILVFDSIGTAKTPSRAMYDWHMNEAAIFGWRRLLGPSRAITHIHSPRWCCYCHRLLLLSDKAFHIAEGPLSSNNRRVCVMAPSCRRRSAMCAIGKWATASRHEMLARESNAKRLGNFIYYRQRRFSLGGPIWGRFHWKLMGLRRLAKVQMVLILLYKSIRLFLIPFVQTIHISKFLFHPIDGYSIG